MQRTELHVGTSLGLDEWECFGILPPSAGTLRLLRLPFIRHRRLEKSVQLAALQRQVAPAVTDYRVPMNGQYVHFDTISGWANMTKFRHEIVWFSRIIDRA